MKINSRLAAILFTFLCLPLSLPGQDGLPEFTSEQLEFFESKVRPVLVANCLQCHGPEKAESSFRVDSRTAILKGGESGDPSAIPGDPQNSLLIQSVHYDSGYDMPPSGKLPDSQIADLEKWIELGLPWPDQQTPLGTATMSELIELHRKNHWAFQPVKKPTLSNLPDSKFPIDVLIERKLKKHQLELAPTADRRTLIRRAYFDLLGVPPTNDVVNQFVNDPDPHWYAKLIDQLLASPMYGERWARHWLDVARYADTMGYTLNNADRNYYFAFTYRDYVIESFNNDLPYDQFIREQLAADYLELSPDKKSLAALGFITVGRKYLQRPETIDDQVDVVTRGLMGLTVSCARCHDHKYDAIPTEDYYSLYGIFNNCHHADDLPLIGSPESVKVMEDYFHALQATQNKLQQFENDKHALLQADMDQFLCDYVTRAFCNRETEIDHQLPGIQKKRSELNLHAIRLWRSFINNRKVVEPIRQICEKPRAEIPEAIASLIASPPADFNPILLQRIKSENPQNAGELGHLVGQILSEIKSKWTMDGSQEPAMDQFEGAEKQLAHLLFFKDSARYVKRDRIRSYFNEADKQEWETKSSDIRKIESEKPPVTRAMVLRENQKPRNARVMIRGNRNNLGEAVPRQFVAVLSQSERSPFQQKSGRLELANKICDPNNPLTARVLVNRVWMHHFNKPLVATPSDFGIRCPQPRQQDVLDWLAADFVENGWSIKDLHRKIMLSRTYQQSSDQRNNAYAIDPENELIWRMNRRRLEFEPLRDSMLSIAGRLDNELYGDAGNLFDSKWYNRRTIYGKIDRQDLPNLLRVFDIASPDQSSAKRIRTTVPQQSLFMMNHPFVLDMAKSAASRATDAGKTHRENIEALYRLMFQRSPSEHELKKSLNFIESTMNNESQLDAWSVLTQVLFCTNEFEFID